MRGRWLALGGVLLSTMGCNCGRVAGDLGPAPINIRTCEGDADCAPSQLCIDKLCQAAIRPDTGVCLSDADCPDARYACTLGVCTQVPGRCLGDDDCAPGVGCDLSSHRCLTFQPACLDGTSRSCGTSEEGTCELGTQTCAGGAWGACVGAVEPAAEACDGLDNDCDGALDEDFDFQNDPANCGGCGKRCVLLNATGGCRAAQCWSSACDPGWHDANGRPDDGCEYRCDQTNRGVETCDGRDNDCDGATDELGTTTCGVGACQRTVANCAHGRLQICEPGTPTSDVCNLLDDDCDGWLDEEVSIFTQDGDSQRVDPIILPMDIVVVIANNGTMNEEIEAVEQNINANFAEIIGQSGIDYRVILLSKYGYGGSTGNYAVCIQPPLGGNAECSGVCPTNTERFFHYSVDISAHDSLSKILSTFAAPDECGLAPGGWSQWLRPEAAKVFVEITDNGPTSGNPDQDNGIGADAFEQRLFALSPPAFGTADAREYRFHSIVGLAENDPAASAWLPQAPLIDSRCTGNGGYVQQPGLEYQKLSVRTEGLRYPICQYQSFDAIFREVARGIVIQSELSCEFSVSQVPPGTSLDNTLMELVGSDGTGSVTLTHVADAASCAGNAFYVEGTAIKLCPDACTLWRTNPTSKAEVTFTCQQQVQ